MNQAVVSAVRRALDAAGLLRADAVAVCAVSGGADSVALLLALAELAAQGGPRVVCAHVEHGLRGEASRADAAYVRALCARRGVALRLYRAGLDARAPGVEERAREARRRAFRDAMDALGADAVLTAHHADDQLETVLMRMLRGGGAGGLRGVPAQSRLGGGWLLRPFLALPKAALEAYVTERGEAWRVDETNALPDCLRNRLRLTLQALPQADHAALRAHMGDSAALLALDEDCLRAQADALLADCANREPPYCFARVAPLRAAPEAIRLRALRALYARALCAICAPERPPALTVQAWDASGIPDAQGERPCELMGEPADDVAASVPALFSAEVAASTPAPFAPAKQIPPPDERGLSCAQSLTLERVLFADSGASVNLPCGLAALRANDRLHIVWQEGRAPLFTAEGLAPLAAGDETMNQSLRWCGWTFRLARAESGAAELAARRPTDDPRRLYELLLPARDLPALILRAPEPTDRFRPLGASGSKPLRRLLTDRKLDAPLRPFQPVVADRDGLIRWLPGLALGESARLHPSEELLRLTAVPPSGFAYAPTTAITKENEA